MSVWNYRRTEEQLMRIAILHEDNHKVPITADEYATRFGARGAHSTWLTCPECGQPVVTRAMSSYSLVDPYFKHENDDPVAQKCPNYVSGSDYSQSGSGSIAPGESADMFIERIEHMSYQLRAGFPAIDAWALEYLIEQEATISFGDEVYSINRDDFSYYIDLYYGVDGPSFGVGLELQGAIWPYNTPMPNIEHTFNGCMLFEALDIANFAERLNARNMDQYDSNKFLLVYSTVDGMLTASFIKALSEHFKVVGTIDGSEKNGDELRVAFFSTEDRNALKALFP